MKTKLDWSDLWDVLNLERDNAGRWYASSESCHPFVVQYCDNYRAPSRAYPYSHAKPLLTAKFARALVENVPELARECGLNKGSNEQ